jgi:hypothetical protein
MSRHGTSGGIFTTRSFLRAARRTVEEITIIKWRVIIIWVRVVVFRVVVIVATGRVGVTRVTRGRARTPSTIGSLMSSKCRNSRRMNIRTLVAFVTLPKVIKPAYFRFVLCRIRLYLCFKFWRDLM